MRMFKVNVAILFLMGIPMEEHVHQVVGFMYVSTSGYCLQTCGQFRNVRFQLLWEFCGTPDSPPPPASLPPTHKDLTLVIHFGLDE